MTDTRTILQAMAEQLEHVLAEETLTQTPSGDDERESPPTVEVSLDPEDAPERDWSTVMWVGLRVAQVPHADRDAITDALDALIERHEWLSIQTTYDGGYDIRLADSHATADRLVEVTELLCTEVYGTTLDELDGVEWNDFARQEHRDADAFLDRYGDNAES